MEALPEIALWLGKWVLGPLVAIVVGLIFSEPLKERLAPLVTMLGSRKDEGLSGLWLATYDYNDAGELQKPGIEVVEISNKFGFVVGRIVPHKLNEDAAKRSAATRPLRVRGSVKDNRYFTGVWFHPERRAHYHGSFNLLIRQNNTKMDGMWLGYSEKANVIYAGQWKWRRLNQ